MRFIKRTSFLGFFALGAVAYGYAPQPEPSHVPLISAVPTPGTVTDYPSFTDEPVFTPAITGEPAFTPVITDEPVFTPDISEEPSAEPSEEPAETPTISSVPPTPTFTTYPTQSSGPVPSPCVKDVCFERKQTCCYKHSVCDTKTKEVKYCKAVKSKKCGKKCEKKCAKVPKTIMKKKCKKQIIYEERKWCAVKWFGMCKPVAVEKEVCCDHAVTIYEQVCKDFCKKVCKPVTVFQIIVKKYKYETFCAKLSCGNIKVAGKAMKPSSYTSKTLLHKANGNVVDNKPAGIVLLN